MHLSESNATIIREGELAKKHAYRIGEVAHWLRVETFVVRYWQDEFGSELGGVERSKRGQRVFSRRQALTFGVIQTLLHTELYTIEGAKRQLRLARAAAKVAG